MKPINKLVLLILMLIKTTPEIVKTYKQIYNNVIKNQEQLIERTKQMIEADIVIKTNYVHPDERENYPQEIKKRLEYQKRKIGVK